MLGVAGHSALKGGEVGGEAVDMEVNKGLLAFRAEEVDVFLEVGVGIVGAEVLAGEVGLEGGDDAAGEEPVQGVFQETAVGVPLALGVDAVTVVDEDLHS